MKVSVLVPVYGVEQYIAQCADSLFSQTYRDVEYIFVDDCSPDRSISVLKSVVSRYPDRAAAVHIFAHDHNRGSGASRLTAMEHASGDFVMFVDSDDFIPADAVAQLVSRQEATGADMVDGAADSYVDGGLHDLQLPCRCGHYAEKMILQNVVPHRLWARLIRRSIFTRHGIQFAEGINQAEDYSVMSRVAFYASRACTDAVVYHYRLDRVSTFADGISPKHVASYLGANRIVADFFRDKGARYQYPLRVGLIHAAYCAVKAGVPIAEVNKALDYHPSGLQFRLAGMLLRHASTLRLARLEYLVLKRLYLLRHR